MSPELFHLNWANIQLRHHCVKTITCMKKKHSNIVPGRLCIHLEYRHNKIKVRTSRSSLLLPGVLSLTHHPSIINTFANITSSCDGAGGPGRSAVSRGRLWSWVGTRRTSSPSQSVPISSRHVPTRRSPSLDVRLALRRAVSVGQGTAKTPEAHR